MKKKGFFILVITMPLIIFSNTSQAALIHSYYGTGSYQSIAPITPTSGLKFYVDYSAISLYGSNAFTAAFDWNGDYIANVAAVAQYPASVSAYPTYFTISTDAALDDYTRGETMYYSSSSNADRIVMTYPMDSSSIYKCRIVLNPNKSTFNVNGTFSTTFLEKVIRHEVGHVFLLKHPSNQYFTSVMHQNAPSGPISATVTTDDRNNIIEKWGN